MITVLIEGTVYVQVPDLGRHRSYWLDYASHSLVMQVWMTEGDRSVRLA